jgi:hypothetical protein
MDSMHMRYSRWIHSTWDIWVDTEHWIHEMNIQYCTGNQGGNIGYGIFKVNVIDMYGTQDGHDGQGIFKMIQWTCDTQAGHN